MTVTVDAEITALRRCLQSQRSHVLGAVEGLSEGETPVSGAALGVELPGDGAAPHAVGGASVFPRCCGRGSGSHRPGRQPVQHMAGGPGLPTAGVLDRYRHELSPAKTVIVASSPDDDPARWPFPEGEWRLHNLRDVLLHVITETACHAGHLDAVRELIDGQQWLVNT